MWEIPIEIIEQLKRKISFYDNDGFNFFDRRDIFADPNCCYFVYETEPNFLIGTVQHVITEANGSYSSGFLDMVIEVFVKHNYGDNKKVSAYRVKKLRKIPKAFMLKNIDELARSMLVGKPVCEYRASNFNEVSIAVIQFVWNWVHSENAALDFMVKSEVYDQHLTSQSVNHLTKPSAPTHPYSGRSSSNKPQLTQAQLEAFLISAGTLIAAEAMSAKSPTPKESFPTVTLVLVGIGAFVFGILVMAIILR